MKPLETYDVPELDRWSRERPWSVIDGREVDNHPPPVSEFPTSEDYYELCDSVGVDRDSPIGFVVFNAVFVTGHKYPAKHINYIISRQVAKRLAKALWDNQFEAKVDMRNSDESETPDNGGQCSKSSYLPQLETSELSF